MKTAEELAAEAEKMAAITAAFENPDVNRRDFQQGFLAGIAWRDENPKKDTGTIAIDPEALRLSKLLEPEQLAELSKRVNSNAQRLIVDPHGRGKWTENE